MSLFNNVPYSADDRIKAMLAFLSEHYPQYTGIRYKFESYHGFFTAYDTAEKRDISIKTYSIYYASDIALFTDDSLFYDIAGLPERNLCRLIDRNFNKNDCFLIMTYKEGKTLDDFLHFDTFRAGKPAYIIRILFGILNGLKLLHNKNIFYGDLTPCNIIIDSDGEAWLCDFSESAYNGSKFSDKTMTNDKHYSPEKKTGQPIDYRSDIYEFGVILSDFLPFFKDDYTRTGLSEIAQKAMKRDPYDRYDSVEEITEAIVMLTRADNLFGKPNA